MNAQLRAQFVARGGASVSDAARDDLSARLNSAYASGDVGEADFQRLLDIVFGARTFAELVPVAEALPGSATYDEPAGVALEAPPPGELVPAEPPSASKVAVYGSSAILILLLIILGVAIF